MAWHSQFAAPVVVGIGLLIGLRGCSTRDHSGEGTETVSYTAPREGNIYVYDATANKTVYTGKLDKGQIIEVDAKDNKVLVDGRTATERDLVTGHRYRLFFDDTSSPGATRATISSTVPNAATLPPPARPTKTVAGVEINELPAYTKAGRNWRNFVIPPNLQRDALIALARDLHSSDSNSSLRFFTDDSQFHQFKLWDQNYPDPNYPSPEAWVAKHYVAAVNKMLSAGGARWELLAMDAGTHLLPPATQSMTIAPLE